MSRIEHVIKRLQERNGARQGVESSTPLKSVVPVARKKKVEIGGEKHRVSQEDLIKGGLLASIDLAVPIADEFRRVKRPLLAIAAQTEGAELEHRNVIMITSAMPGAGKTFCAVNLAVSISLERELNVLLVDADVAKPHISREFGLGEAPGLIDLLLGETGGVQDVLVRTDLNDILVLPAGRQHPQATELLASDRMSRIMSELASRYADRIILLDSPPLLITSEAEALASQVGQIAIVVEAGSTSHQALAQMLERLDPQKAINLILNKTRHWGRAHQYYGGYGHYGYSAE